MATENNGSHTPWQELYGPNLGYIQEQYDIYRTDASAVDPELKDLFDQWGAPPSGDVNSSSDTTVAGLSSVDMEKVVAAAKLADNIRVYGHLAANIHAINGVDKDTRMLEPETYGLNENDLIEIPAQVILKNPPKGVHNALDVVNHLKTIYTQSLTYEFGHIHDVEEHQWLNEKIESGAIHPNLTHEERIELLKRLTDVEGFETFLHKTFVGQKRFSIEGVDTLVPMLEQIVKAGVKNGVENAIIGMAHRGRLNVLAHVLNKPYKRILAEFAHTTINDDDYINEGWAGDVKYHLGGHWEVKEGETVKTRITLANNPSHLEVVDPVVEGYARAAQEDRGQAGNPYQDFSKAFTIMVHGDAAFPGEGVVAETLNLSRLPGFTTGGTVHIIANNLIGFTTESNDGRSTRYASDLAKGYEIPIVHVNADDPEACLAAANLAFEYREKYGKDFLIDLIGYRRFGHNEMDDPSVTQPKLYELVHAHDTVRALYAKQLEDAGVITADDARQFEQNVQENLQSIYDEIKENGNHEVEPKFPAETIIANWPTVNTSVSLEQLKEINTNLLKWPEGFNVYKKLDRILSRRKDALEEGGKVDWGHAETLAFATILSEGTPIRFTGQDAQRGTFAHRHLMLHDEKDGKTFSPLHVLPQAKASFAIFNSPLSETAVLGYEYGYNVFSEETLVLWEAQYGDFANVAQPIFDQFISAGRAKWGQKSGLVMLLPHGYEGQGAEHSSARLERYLQLAAEGNWTVANLTSAAQYFHLLRRQAAMLGKEGIRPLVLMTPKSLLRNQIVASEASAFTNGHFQEVIEQPAFSDNPDNVERIVLSSGRISLDLTGKAESVDHNTLEKIQLVRVEQLYPFPEQELKEIIKKFKNVKELVWVQEEPKNMGAWMFIEPRLRALVPKRVNVNYVGRPEAASTAVGEPGVHKIEQESIASAAFNLN
ncbi:2-oxoglutarate dehydrogenase E1 component [Pullulanibacillus pueri]|uniref:2-oxoglutarate dehydrogenase E1 component n=1 Tax=Pullulanibacillus pueri TaxID=1437324 RepID=A0A8J3EPK5_9BACL|nr:2-oxoglutarate dehydrogenase E1 component [Pullulanibacillus pueri]MBM7684226.1 2-oxoglutarate dehydrogenase E1 component [Pullulanibacillus pueri]GGH89018.1 2-oxoglutarate dehydrogenase E1 component [Pullulanibacillus pueri]